MTLPRWVENVGAMTLSLAIGAHNESCVLSLISALPAHSHRSMETFADARWFEAAESAQEIRDPKSYPSCALAFLISHEIAKYLERLGSRHSCSPLISPCALFPAGTSPAPSRISWSSYSANIRACQTS